ncbi:diaminopimelate epimerase [Aquipuribacter nitratireducens]|uniref:Diaminopimelate epimerase n=1 Tax=Aquipuribacter nitratireducens TaxID=650104 RepID=A0ABW0GJK7_9MICO
MTSPLRADGLHAVKAHGTGNDFVVVVDPDDTWPLDPAVVRALCDRRTGVGADGVIRAVRADVEGRDGWFMDHVNADGSLAEMCGNGVRVLAHGLVDAGLVPADAGEVPVLSRAGARPVRLVAGGYPVYAVDMGPVTVADDVVAVTVRQGERVRRLPGLAVDVGNPHVVVDVGAAADVLDADLTVRPGLEPEPSHGANVELIGAVGRGEDPHTGYLRMRVHERGVGETLSCGTGAVAAAVAAASRHAHRRWTVDVPGGRLRVRLRHREGVGLVGSELAGPATVVARLVVDHGWLARAQEPAPAQDETERETTSTR